MMTLARGSIPVPVPSLTQPGRRTSMPRQSLLDRLRDPGRWQAGAAAALADFGFRLIEPAPKPGDDGHLLVALRERPTLGHFDPESVVYYAPAAGGAARATLDRAQLGGMPGPSRSTLWGQVHVIDRIPVTNRFLTFGGTLRIAVVDPTLTILDLWSPAPIVRWGGHSQGTDQLTEAIGAFFGRLMIPVDFTPGAAERIDGLDPRILYLAFLHDAQSRNLEMRKHGAGETQLDRWLAAAMAHGRLDALGCAAARELLDDLSL
jgi:hypothetical protein